MKKRSVFSNGGMLAFLSGLAKRRSGQMIVPTRILIPTRPTSKTWMVFIPGMPGMVIPQVQAKPEVVNDNPLGCE
jgi:hypothetical protein